MPVPIDTLLDGDSPRLSGIDQDHVAVLAQSVEPLPPIVVHRQMMRVVDGTHRLHAAMRNGRSSVDVVWFDGTEAEAFLHAVESNIRHGLPLTLADRKESASRILQSYPEWSDRAIAIRTGLSGKTVGALRRVRAHKSDDVGPAARVGNDGRTRALNPAEGRLRCCEVLAERGETASLREIAAASGVSVETARDVRERWKKGENPLPPGASGETVSAVAGKASEPAVGPHPSAHSLPARTCASRTETVDPRTLLDLLRRDPAIRYCNEKRAMVRWLEAHVISTGEAEIVHRAPAHQVPRIVTVARACAASWDSIARDLERLSDT